MSLAEIAGEGSRVGAGPGLIGLWVMRHGVPTGS
jgi:hypothetical protein